ncbi:MAG TPA: FAD-dependent thymidylate synthase [Holophagaceae bacterium]|nr:FAD-dependent thymidylate synthase [Holophagaceae bacterium]HJW32241.1 FAD-dependent thymidylate synthase [Holophagaceae bacterium]
MAPLSEVSVTEIPVLDKGFVKLIDHMGSDLSVVNAARVSFGKRKDAFDEGDAKLIKYLAKHEHTSPFRHTALTLHVKAPIFVFRQWMKHRIGSEFNEISGRYVVFPDDEFYVPEVFRMQSKDNKQGSFGEIEPEHRGPAAETFLQACKDSVKQYRALLEMGVCKEQARCVLPVGLYSEVYWTVSLQAVAHFIRLRSEGHAQWEIQQYAHAVAKVVEQVYPVSLKALLESEVG